MVNDTISAQQPRVARVAVDVSHAHLDRLFDYLIGDKWLESARPGVRVRVRFSGRLTDGIIVDIVEESSASKLASIERVISPEVVLTDHTQALIRAVADHYGGTFADVARLAIPPRHGVTEKAPAATFTDVLPAEPDVLARYHHGPSFAEALAAGRTPRASWLLAPSSGPAGDWARAMAEAASACVQSGRRVLLLTPDAVSLDHLVTTLKATLGKGTFAVMSAEKGPAARYRGFLAAVRGSAQIVVGNRSAAFAPVPDLGLVAVYDEGDDSYAEPKAPYPHTRQVAGLRAGTSALLYVGYTRSAQVQAWVESGWLHALEPEPDKARRACAVVRAGVHSDVDVARDPDASKRRLPSRAYETLREGLTRGNVLVQVARTGYVGALRCAGCAEMAQCPSCRGPVTMGSAHTLQCEWCDRLWPVISWRCPVCQHGHVRRYQPGAGITAEQLGRSFPQTVIHQSTGSQRLAQISGEHSLVIATPGAEPRTAHGYAAAVILDADSSLLRPDLRVVEECLRRWMHAVALVQSAEEGGTVVIVGAAGHPAVQALIRLDAAGAARRELAQRAEAELPPMAHMASVDLPRDSVHVAQDFAWPAGSILLGPVEIPHSSSRRLLIKVGKGQGRALARAAQAFQSMLSTRKLSAGVRVKVDPQELG